MKTHEILTATEAELAPKLKEMKLKELERHAEKLLAKYGQPDYNAVMRTVIQSVPSLSSGEREPFATLQAIVRSQLALAQNDAEQDEEAIRRITVILMVIVKKKFLKIHKQ